MLIVNKFLFLDVDGVLNLHEQYTNGYCGISPLFVNRLNIVLEETNAMIVVSSAWRYLVHKGSMTLDGLENLLLTHGLNVAGKLAGITEKDRRDNRDNSERGFQIANWIRTQYSDIHVRVVFAVVDDMEINKPEFVAKKLVLAKDGFTKNVAKNLIHILNG